MSAQRNEDDLDYGSVMQKAWEGGLGDYTEQPQSSASLRFDDEGIPLLGDYTFGAFTSPKIEITSLLTSP